MKSAVFLFSALGGLLTLGAVGVPQARGSEPVRYRLIQGTTLTLETGATNAAGPVRTGPVKGSFWLRLENSGMYFDYSRLENFQATASLAAGGTLPILGSGTYRVEGRIVLNQQMRLEAQIDGAGIELTNALGSVTAEQPLIDILLEGSRDRGAAQDHYSLHLVAVPERQAWHYRLLGPSTLLDDCPPCDRLSRPQPLRGGFDLVLFAENPIRARYALTDVELEVGSGASSLYRVTGGGLWDFGGEVAVTQHLTLETEVQTLSGTVSRSFTNDAPALSRQWPLLEIDLTDTAGQFAQVYHLHLLAAPLREIWFSTRRPLTAGNAALPTNRLSAGDLLSEAGRLVRANANLIARLALPTNSAPYDLDAVDIGSGGEIFFSLGTGATSPSLGPLQPGDLLSDRGRLIKRNQELTALLGVMPLVPDLGLDAVHVLSSGEVLFSITQDVFSERLGQLHHGDLLSDRGEVRKLNKELLARFHPEKPDHDCGLDALYVWPHGEIWFSAEEGFNDTALGPIMEGDLLSDQGYVVFHNLELLGPFAPLEDLADFGLDALHVVTDTDVQAGAPRLVALRRDSLTGNVVLGWEGKGRVFQVERTFELGMPFTPVSALMPDMQWIDPNVSLAQRRVFYRVKQW